MKKAVGFIALFSPTAWRAAHRTAREAVIIARNMALAAAAVLAVLTYWWQRQSSAVHAVVIIIGAGLAGWWLYHLMGRPKRPTKRPIASEEPTQVLYRWWEPDDLPEGTICFCGKPRVAGELVYVGITGAHRSRELDEDRRTACWWQPGLEGTTETFMTRDEVEAAEIEAIRSEHPRENKQHAKNLGAFGLLDS